MAVIRQHELGIQVCKALGIDPNKVRFIDIIMDADSRNDPVTVYVKMVADEHVVNDVDWTLARDGVTVEEIERGA